MKRRTFLQAATASLAAPAIARAQGTSTLKFVPQADLAVLDPVYVTAYVTRNHAFMVYDTLYGIDAAYTPQPQMVEGHVIADDGRHWTFTLREGLRFHDGTPVLARDAVASITRWASRDAFGAALTAATDEMKATSDRVFEIRLKKPFPALPYALGHGSNAMLPVMPARLADTPGSKPVTEVIGSGPFRYVPAERVAGSLNVYRKFDGYVPRPSGTPSFTAGPKIAYLDRVEWHTIPDAATAAGALQAGEVDWWEQPTTDLLPLLRRQPEIRVVTTDPAGNIGFLRFNCLYPPFDNPAIRAVVLKSVEQANFMTAVVGPDPALWHVPAGVFTPGTPLATGAGLSVFEGERNWPALQAELKAAGYKGEKVNLLAATDFPAIDALCEVTADTFRKLGLNLDYQALDWGTVTQRRNSQSPPDHGGWNTHCTYTAGYDLLSPATNPSLNAIGRAGFIGWPTDPELAALRNQWFDAPDLADQKAICDKIQARFLAAPPYVPLGQFFAPTAWRSDVTGILHGAFSLFWNVKKA